MSWLQLGDSNTTFFHKVVQLRRRRKKINSIQVEDNNIREAFSNFYSDLWSVDIEVDLNSIALLDLKTEN